MALRSIKSLSLDTAILPGGGRALGFQKLAFVATLAIVVLRTVMPSAISRLRSFAFDDDDDDDDNDDDDDDGDNNSANMLNDRKLQDVVPLVSAFRDAMAKIVSAIENVVIAMNTRLTAWYDELRGRLATLVQPAETLQLDGWKVCSMKSRELLSGGRYCRYRFELEKGGAMLPLYIGQEVRSRRNGVG